MPKKSRVPSTGNESAPNSAQTSKNSSTSSKAATKPPQKSKKAASEIEHFELPKQIQVAKDAGNIHHANELQGILDAANHGDTNYIVQLATNLAKAPTDWEPFHQAPAGHKVTKIWVDGGNLYQLRQERNHSIVYDLAGHTQFISSVGTNDIIGRGKVWLKVGSESNEVEWHGEHDSKNVWQFGIPRPEFPTPVAATAEVKKHLIKSSGPQIYHITEDEGIVEYNLIGRNPHAEWFGTFGAGDCESAKGWTVHGDVIYWINKGQLVCSSKEVNEPRKPYDVVPWRIHNGAVGYFTIAINGFIFVYNKDKNAIEWTKTVSGDRANWNLENLAWEEFGSWDGDDVDELVVSAGAADSAHFLGVRSGEDVQVCSIGDICKA
ncbi:hypothetical protein TWF718_010272 [Orbilia javanica]|uniref:Uncharacterized protein n=1 Tax=Orbilia javanica TaxID=47235 RepID=A0AAN8RDU7_9PEZI